MSGNNVYYQLVSGQINITEFSDSTHKIAATFFFTAYNATNAQDTISVTNGTVSISDMVTE